MTIRKIGLVSRTYRSVNRYRQILTVLFKYGFGDLIDTLNLAQYLEIGLHLLTRKRHEHTERLSRAERVRLVCEELGPTFIKLGQVVSTRPDLVPADWIEELKRLQQHVPPFPFEQAREIIEAELKRPLHDIFPTFEEGAFAAASIGQAHRATLPGGDSVVVKVQRPGIREVIETDLEILLHLATLAERHIEALSVQRPTRIVEEFARSIERELDFTIEASNLEHFARMFVTDPTIYVPRAHRRETAERVLTMEFVDGLTPVDTTALAAAGLDCALLARRGAEAVLKQVFEHGFFHADPHPGNLLALPNNVVCFLDFGMMGRIDRRTRERCAELVYSVAQRDAERTAAVLLQLMQPVDEIQPDLRHFEADVAEMIDTYLVARLGDLQLGKLLQHLVELANRHRLAIPADLVMMLKSLATIEQVGSHLDPNLDMLSMTRPYVQRLKLGRFGPRRLFNDLTASGGDLLNLARDLPRNLRDLLRLARRGELKMAFEHRGLQPMIEANERIANRVSFAIVVAAMIIGSAVIVHAQIPPKWNDVSLIGIAGFLAAGILGFWLLLGILRHGRL